MTAIPVTNPNGVALTGLTAGITYVVESSGGPWYPTGNSSRPGAYSWEISLDGTSWSGGITTSSDPWAIYINGPRDDSYCPGIAVSRNNTDTVHAAVTIVASVDKIWVRVADNIFGDNTGGLDALVSLAPTVFTGCPCGSEQNPDAIIPTLLTGALVEAAIVALCPACSVEEIAVWALGTGTIIGAPISPLMQCSQPAPLIPVFTDDDFILGTQIWSPSSIPKHMQLLGAALWNMFCRCRECDDGTREPNPTLTMPTLPSPSNPARTTINETSISITLDNYYRVLQQFIQNNYDQSSHLEQIQNIVYDMSTNIQNVTNQVNNLSNYYTFNPPPTQTPVGPPVSFPGPGIQTASGIRGLVVTLTSVPIDTSESMATPNAYYRVGWVHVGSDIGWRRAIPIHVSPQLVDLEPGDTQWVLTLTPGVEADVQPYTTP